MNRQCTTNFLIPLLILLNLPHTHADALYPVSAEWVASNNYLKISVGRQPFREDGQKCTRTRPESYLPGEYVQIRTARDVYISTEATVGARGGEYAARNGDSPIYVDGHKIVKIDAPLYINTVCTRDNQSPTIPIPPRPVTCSIIPKDVNLGNLMPSQKNTITNTSTTMVCNGTTNVRIKLPISNIVFTEGATSNVTTQPSSGVIEVKENQTAPIPLVFDTNVSSSSEAGKYTQSLVVTAEIQ